MPTNFLFDAPVLPANIDPVNHTAQAVFTFGQITPMLIFMFLAYRYQRGYGTPIPWLMMVGGLGMALVEPLVDRVGLVWFPTGGQWGIYTDYGVSQPIWLILAYVWFFGGRAMYIWHCLEQGRGTDRLFLVKNWATVFVIDIALESVGLGLGVFFYYGNQPLQVGKFPLWWAAINSATPIILAVTVFLLRGWLKGWRVLLVVPLAPAVCAAVNGGIGWITWDAINNTTLPSIVVQLAGCATVASALMLLRVTQGLMEVCAKAGVVALDGSQNPRVDGFRKRIASDDARAPVPVSSGSTL